jgi:DNA-directed RNA polymerase subunit RPC12/RpoP
MNYLSETSDVYCPYCGERIEILIDLSIDQQEYVEDCSVCCRPILLSIQVTEAGALVTARHENE